MIEKRDQVAYAAGLFDGEGTVGIYQVKGWNKTQGIKYIGLPKCLFVAHTDL